MPETATVYMDHAATTPLRPEAREAFLRVAETAWGNPSSTHRVGREARAVLEDARAGLAALLGAAPREIVFTRGGTESDNLAVLGRHASEPLHARLLVASTEHRAVLASAAAAHTAGRPVEYLPVDSEGRVDLDSLDAGPTALVSVACGNNETGVQQDMAEMAARCRSSGVVLHTDAVQALGKVSLRVDEIPVSMLSLSAHKVGGPRGVGALFVRQGTALGAVLHGGGQERGLRPGTEDVAGAAAFVAAAQAAEAERAELMPRLSKLRARLEEGLLAAVPGLRLNGAGAERLPTITSASIPDVDPELLLAALDLEGIAASSGSACSSGSVQPSHVLTAMGLPPELAGPSLRFSLGHGTEPAHIERVLGVLPAIVARLRS